MWRPNRSQWGKMNCFWHGRSQVVQAWNEMRPTVCYSIMCALAAFLNLVLSKCVGKQLLGVQYYFDHKEHYLKSSTELSSNSYHCQWAIKWIVQKHICLIFYINCAANVIYAKGWRAINCYLSLYRAETSMFRIIVTSKYKLPCAIEADVLPWWLPRHNLFISPLLNAMLDGYTYPARSQMICSAILYVDDNQLI